MRRERLLEFFRAITIAAGPRFCSVLMSAIAPRVRVLHTEQLEILFPVRTFFRERLIAKTGLNPRCDILIVYPRLVHVVKEFSAAVGTFPSRAIIIPGTQMSSS